MGLNDHHEELESHVAMRAEHDGTDTNAARRRLGNMLRTEEDMRRVWVSPIWDVLAQDARFAWRSFRRSPGFALTAVGVLAMGLGASTALFSVLDRILFRSLPYADAGRLVSVGLLAPLDSNEFLLTTDYAQLWRETPAPFESVTTFFRGAAPCDVMDDQPERLSCLSVEANFLRVLGVSVAAGRDFTPADDVPGAPLVALIRHSLWARRFGLDPNAIGRALNLDGKQVRIVGVLRPDFELPNLGGSEVLLPSQIPPIPRGAHVQSSGFLGGIARLKPGVTPQQAYAALQPLFRQMLENVPAAFRREVTLRLRTLRDRQMGDARRQAWLLLGAVVVLLLIACVNVTNLLATRLATREREFAVRTALGASKARLARLALTESTLLALVSGALGLALAAAMLRIFVAMAPGGIPKIQQASLDLRVLTVALVASLAVGCMTGLWPAFAMLRSETLHSRGLAAMARPWARLALVTAQIALTVAMLGSSSLLLRSLWKLAAEPLGFDSTHVLVARVSLNAAKYRSEQQAAFFEDLLARASQIQGVAAAALSDSLPPRGATALVIFANIEAEGRPSPPEGTGGMVPWRLVTPRFFDVMRIPIVRGRAFEEADRKGPPAIILSESLARRLFPGDNPIGKHIQPQRGQSAWHVVVGIARDVRDEGPTAGPKPTFYVVRPRSPAIGRMSMILTLRSDAPAGWLRQEIAAIDPHQPVEIETLQQRVAAESNPRRFTAWLVALFAGFALLLAVAGLSGTASYLVAQRRREIGVRMALGATPTAVAQQVLREAAIWTAAGACGGIVLAGASAKLIRSQFFGVTASDPASWSAAMGVLALALGVAVLRPAIRAARTDPAVTLRTE